VSHLGFGRNKILRLLYENREGLGHNEMKADVGEKTLRKWIPELKRKKFIKIDDVKGLGGTKHVHVLTLKGIEYVERNVVSEKFLKRFLELYDAYSEEERLKILSQIFRDMFESFVWYGSLDNVKRFHNAIESEVKDFLNNNLFDLKKKEMVKLFKSKDMEQRGFGGSYHAPFYGIRDMRVGFILKDLKIAWELGHYLNRHHVYLSTKLGLSPSKEIKDRNEKWLQQHKLSRDEDVKEEIRERIELFKQQFPEWIKFIPSDYGNFIKDIR